MISGNSRKAPPSAARTLLVDSLAMGVASKLQATNQNQVSLADHRYQQRQQVEFLLDAANSSIPIGRNRSIVDNDVIANAAAEISPIFPFAFSAENFFNNLTAADSANFFAEYETVCEPISPAAGSIPIPIPHANKFTLHQSNFDFTPPLIDYPLYTAASDQISNSSSCSNFSYSSPGSNSIQNYSPSDPNKFISTNSSSSSSSPVWHDQFLNINELLPEHNFSAFNDPIFGQSPPINATTTFDDFLSIVQQQQESHVTTPSHVKVISIGAEEEHEEGTTNSVEKGAFPIDRPPSSNQSYFAAPSSGRSITIRLASDNSSVADGVEFKKKAPPLLQNLIGGQFDQSASFDVEKFKNQQEILEEIYRECEKHMKNFNSDSENSQSAQTPPIYNQSIVHLDLDDDDLGFSVDNQSSNDRPLATAVAMATADFRPSSVVERNKIRAEASRDQPPIKKQKSKQQLQDSSAYSPVIADWLSDEEEEISQNGDFDETEVKKRRQNRKAASKYRSKRKIEKISIESERNKLEDENRRLRSIVDDRQREIDYLRKFLDEIRGASSNKARK